MKIMSVLFAAVVLVISRCGVSDEDLVAAAVKGVSKTQTALCWFEVMLSRRD